MLALTVTSPSIGGLTVHYSLASVGVPARLELFDITGRRVACRELAPSRQTDGSFFLDRAGLRPGVFLMRLTQGGQTVIRRAVMLP